jgi:glycosyltransferase involved in cell wall biosynthesis
VVRNRASHETASLSIETADPICSANTDRPPGLSEHAIDLIEATEHGSLFVALWMKNFPLIIRLHGERYTFHKYTPDLSLISGVRITRLLQRVALRLARILISPSETHVDEVATELGRRHPPIENVYNTVTRSFVASPDAKSELPLPPISLPKVLYVGRLERRKGIPLLLEAAKEVVRREPTSSPAFTHWRQAWQLAPAKQAYIKRALKERFRSAGDHRSNLGEGLGRQIHAGPGF